MTTLPNPSNFRGSFDDLDEFQSSKIPSGIMHVMVGSQTYKRTGGGDITIADGSEWAAVTGDYLKKTGDVLAAALVLQKAGFPLTINGEGNINLTVGNGSAADTTFTANDLWINLEAATDVNNSSRARVTRSGGFTLRHLVAGVVQSIVDAGANRLQMKFEDGSGEVSRIEAQDGGEILIGASGGVIMLRNGDDSGIAPLPINSDDGNYAAHLNNDGQVVRSHPLAKRTLGGPTQPADGTTVAYHRHQIYLDRVAGTINYADSASTDPDASAAGSTWEVISAETIVDSGAPVNGTTTAYKVGQKYFDTATSYLYIATSKSTDPASSAAGSVWQKVLV